MSNYYEKTAEEVCRELKTDPKGLSAKEAEERLASYGKNELAEGKKKSAFMVFLEQFKDLLICILIAAGIVSMITGEVESTIVIFAVIILNAVLGTVQYLKAEKSLEGLKVLSMPTAKVMRNGSVQMVKSMDVVPGDVLILEAGDMVVADARMIESYSLKVNESSLTGESEAVEKISGALRDENMPLGDRKNMVYSGSLVTYGRAVAVVTGTGMQTEIGKIANLLNQTSQRKTPLQIKLDEFSRKLAIGIMAVCVLVFGLSVWRNVSLLDSLLFAVALAVAAIPEALSSIVTIVLALGTRRMSKEHAIMKELKAVESLGAVSVICSDKTGTLTQNKMTVQEMYTYDRLFDAENVKLSRRAEYLLVKAAVLVNDATVDGEGKEVGDPTEVALVQMGKKLSVDEIWYRKNHPRLAELAFDSDRKLMSTVHGMDGENYLFTKGAMDVLLKRSVRVMTEQGEVEMTDEIRQKFVDMNHQFSDHGLRVLAFAYCPYSKDVITPEDEKDYTFIGLISMMDPPRPESMQAVADAKRGGIKTVMITGDHKITAAAIARKIGIFEEGDLAVEGVELDRMSDEELAEKLPRISVYARVSPEHKIRIVSAWQKRGNIVSMTGDGVNDAPALKRADIGVAMGITGTEVSKDAASMILTDDNFATIVKAVANGRSVYRNIKNAIKFLLSGNTAAILAVLFASIAGLPVPFLPVHLLFINLLTDSLPAIAIGMEPAGKGLLNVPPRNPKEPLLNKRLFSEILLEGLIIGVCTMGAYFVGRGVSNGLATTMAFATLTLARLFHGFNCRGEENIFKLKLTGNKYSVYAFLVGVLLLAGALFVPFFERLFSVAPMSGVYALIILGLAFLPTLLIQIVKTIRTRG